jgi:hypothetical protein
MALDHPRLDRPRLDQPWLARLAGFDHARLHDARLARRARRRRRRALREGLGGGEPQQHRR